MLMFNSKTTSYLSISIIVDQNNKILPFSRSVFAKRCGSFTTPLTCFENCFNVYDRLTPYLQCFKFDQFINIDTPYVQYRIHSAILRNDLNLC